MKNALLFSRDFSNSIFFLQYVDWSSEEQDVKDAMITNETAKVQLLFGLLSSSIEMIRRFCERIPGISELCSNDKDILFYSACLELFILRTAYRYVNNFPIKKYFEENSPSIPKWNRYT